MGTDLIKDDHLQQLLKINLWCYVITNTLVALVKYRETDNYF